MTFHQQAQRAQRRHGMLAQQRNERGLVVVSGGLAPGDGTLARDERAHLRSDRPRPKQHRHPQWPSADA